MIRTPPRARRFRKEIIETYQAKHHGLQSRRDRRRRGIGKMQFSVDQIVMNLRLECMFRLLRGPAKLHPAPAPGNIVHHQSLRPQPCGHLGDVV